VEIQTFHFEIRDIISQFIAAFDDVVINRYDKNRTPRSNVKVRYVYSPKERVLFDLVNKAQNMTLPVIAVNVTGISRDESRVFSKLYGFDESDHYQDLKPGKSHAHINMPTPVNIDVSMSILTEYQTDMDQILSNFIPYTNPYVVIAWKIPDEIGAATTQEIRSQVLWSGSMAMNYPTDTTKSDKYRIEATTSFTIKGWLFQKENPKQQNIFFVKTNFSSALLECDNFYAANSEAITLPTRHNTRTIEFSAAPACTSIFFHGTLIDDNFIFQKEEADYPFMLLGNNYDHTTSVLLSSPSTILSSAITVLNFDYYPPVSAYNLPLSCFNIINNYTIELNLPELVSNGKFNIIVANRAGWNAFRYDFNIGDAPDSSLLPPPEPPPPPVTEVMGKYFFSWIDNDWYNVLNWWSDENKSIQATIIPDETVDVIILPATLRPVVDLDNFDWVDPKSIDATQANGITFTSETGSKVYSPIVGDVIYNGNASHG
jgi:hypothetical protein